MYGLEHYKSPLRNDSYCIYCDVTLYVRGEGNFYRPDRTVDISWHAHVTLTRNFLGLYMISHPKSKHMFGDILARGETIYGTYLGPKAWTQICPLRGRGCRKSFPLTL